MRIVSTIKQQLLPVGSQSRTIKTGPFRGIRMDIDLAHQTQLYLGLFERETYKWLTGLSKGIKSAIDIGAANGEYTLYFLLRTPAKRIFSFEPDLAVRKQLLANLKLNHLQDDPRLDLSPMCIGAENSGVMKTLDSLIASLSLPCLIKVDVDGGEMDVLRGGMDFLKLQGTRWILETHSTLLERECMRLMDSAGLETRIVPNAWWRCIVPELRVTDQNRWLVATR